MKKIALILATTMLASSAFSQFFDRTGEWKRKRNEYTLAFGLANYLGDLGGLDKQGTYYFLFDMEFSQFKKAYGLSHRYNVSAHSSISTSFNYGKIQGSDELTAYVNRNDRNLSFESKVIEFAGRYEYWLMRPQPGHIYRIKGAKGTKANKFGVYGTVGLGGFYFNPKTSYEGQMVALQPLGTEGQGLAGGPKSKYSLINMAIPMGFGVQYAVSNNYKLGVEMIYRFTTTDYIDDVSGVYYDNEKLSEGNGEVAAALGDRTLGNVERASYVGGIRGNPTNRDAYLFAQLTLTASFYSKKPGSLAPKKYSVKRSRRNVRW